MEGDRQMTGEDPRPLDVRRAGVLLHVTSLPSAERSRPGDLGPEAYRFVDFLAAAGCTVWQVLPLVPTHEADRSPYNALSAMAGSPELISRERQRRGGLIDRRRAHPDAAALAFEDWCAEHADWLEPYVEFMALRDAARTTRRGRPGSRACVTATPQRVAEVLAPHAGRGAGAALRAVGVRRRSGAELRAYAADAGRALLR